MSKATKQALQIAIDYMNDRLEDHDCKYQRHPATEAERINILADIETVKEALAKQEGQSNFCPQCEALARELKAVKQEQGEPVAFKCGDAIVHIKPPVYGNTTPQQRTWVGLTDEEWSVICDKNNMLPDFDLKEEIEAKLKEKNT